ncbi:MAG TPA: flavin reductase family protein [Acidimicrobiia bacterium]|jgi:flavin reductase (DIM6/NTAB) family NADH-FMN oxidoreductase RutF
MTGGIHDENPFKAPGDERDPVRRFRGRLAAPVTIVTAGDADERTGLTVSSLVVAEGAPSLVYVLVGPTTDLWLAIQEFGRFIVHVCRVGDEVVSDVFAGLRPSPGGMFAGLDVDQTDHGPLLTSLATRAYCTLRRGVEESYSVLVSGEIDRVDLVDSTDPLLYYRGRYTRRA